MKTVCAWCRAEMEKGDDPEDKEITHGICHPCVDLFFDLDNEQSIAAFIEGVDAPVIVFDSDVTIIAANKKALVIHPYATPVPGRTTPGEMVQCAYAKLPEGCGNTIHCYGCAVRNAIEKTMETGAGVNRLPTYKKVFIDDDIVDKKIYMTVQQSHELIYVIIE